MLDVFRKYINYMLLAVSMILITTTFSMDVMADTIRLTDEEKQFIEDTPIIVTAVDPEFSPYEFIDTDGLYKGIAADYLKLIEIRTGLNFKVLEDLSWEEAYDLALEGEVDVLPCVGITRQRKELFLFSDVYLTYQRVLLSRQDSPTHSFDELDKISIGVQRNSSHYSFLLSETEVEPVLYTNNDELLLALTYGEIEAAITNYASSRYRIKQLGLTNIKIDEIYEGDESSATEFGMAVNPDKAILVSIINKALDEITQEEKIEIDNRWLGIEQAPDYSRIIRNVVIGILVVLILFSMFSYWNYRLQKEIRHRTIIEEELMIAKAKADQANKAKSIFLANMSHEIRTPMNAILGHAQILMRDDSLSKKNSGSVTSIKNSGEHLLEIINDVLDMSKIESGKIQLMPSSFYLHALLEEIMEMFEFRTRKYGLYLKLIFDEGLPNLIKADKKRIRQVLINLIGNAVKFTEAGGVSILVKVMNEQISIEVSDTGVGIKEDQMASIFLQFQQSYQGNRIIEGTGLGLTISKSIAEMMNGDLTVESEFGKGSSFCYTFDYEAGVSEEVKAYNKHKVIQGIDSELHYTIMVVDDRYDNRVVARLMLESVGYFVIEAENGEEAVKLYEQDKPDLIAMDIVMPIMDGVKATEIIKKMKGGKDTPIIAVSASALDEERNEVLRHGADAFIKKPLIDYEFLSDIGKLLNLTYIYKDEEKKASDTVHGTDVAEQLKQLPESILIEFKQAIRTGDLDDLEKMVELIEPISSDISSYIKSALDSLDLERLQLLIQ